MKTARDMPPRPAMKAGEQAEQRASYPLVLIFAVLALGILAGGILSYRHFERHFRTGIEEQLSAITELKVEQIVHWRHQRLANAEYLRRTPYVARRALNVLAKPAVVANRQNFTAALEALFVGEPYAQALLLDERLNVGLVYPEGTSGALSEATRRAAQEALSSRQVVLTDLHRETEGGPIYLSLMVPLVVRRERTGDNVPAADKGSSPTDRSAGLLVLQVNAQKELYPLIRRWPTPSRTAETLLVRREDNNVLFLNELRFQTNAPLKLRIPLADTNAPAVKAALGQAGIVEGIDYRGKPVLASLRAIPDSPWSMVARMDLAEVYAPLRERLWLTVLLMGTLFLGAGASVALVWRQQHVQFYRERHEAVEAIRESERRLSEAQRMAQLGYWIWNIMTGDVEWSEEVFRIFHLDPTEFTPHIDSILALSPWPEDHGRDQELVRKAMASHEKGVYEQRFLRPDKSTGYYHSTFQGTYDDEGNLISIVGTIQDITERKRAEQQIQQQLDELCRWQAVMLGREDRTMIVKREVNELLLRLGEPIRYPSQAEGRGPRDAGRGAGAG